MTLEEKVGLVSARMAISLPGMPASDGVIGSAASTPGIERLGLPRVQESDASLGVSNPFRIRPDDTSTALPASLLLGATFDAGLAGESGEVVGSEARAMGFAVQLAGGANLIREPRNGRNFEYLSEDPVLTGMLVGAAIAGVQSRHMVSTVKHFALNAQETGRVMIDAVIGERALRESDLLAFQIAIERGAPGSVMTAYNSVNGDYASENEFLLPRVLKGDWGFTGYVMSDWGGTHSTVKAAVTGLDRQSGLQLDTDHYFGPPLAEAVSAGQVTIDRLDDMVGRMLGALIGSGFLDDHHPEPPDLEAHAGVARRVADEGIVLLANQGVLPVPPQARLAVIGGHADIGVLSGGGSSQVVPVGSHQVEVGPRFGDHAMPKTYHPSSPLAALRQGGVSCTYCDGADVAVAVAAAGEADIAVVFAEQWMTEGQDAPDLALPDGQDDLIRAVAGANPRTVVVLETGGPVLMPWLDDVAAVVAAWYPGCQGGEAIAAILTGVVNPAGRLPVSWPGHVGELPRPVMTDPADTTSNPGWPRRGPFAVSYDIEGSDVGYRWYERWDMKPLFPFGFGLSYTSFALGPLSVTGAAVRDAAAGSDGFAGVDGSGGRGGAGRGSGGASGGAGASGGLRVSALVRNTGERAGIATPQFYVELPVASGARSSRLAGWARVHLEAGEERRVEVDLEPRALAVYDVDLPGWRTHAGAYRIRGGFDSATSAASVVIELPEGTRPP
jgi:beta-glucosidase